MSKSYQQLTEEERIEIYALKREEKSNELKVSGTNTIHPRRRAWAKGI